MKSGLDQLLQRIAMDGCEQVANILTEAEGQAKAIAERYVKLSDRLYEEDMAAGQSAASRKKEQALTVARLDAKKEVLAAKWALVEHAFELASQKISSLPQEAYLAFLGRLVAAAAVSGRESVQFGLNDQSFCSAAIAAANRQLSQAGRCAKLTLCKEPGAFSRGVILRDGRQEINCTLLALIVQAKERLISEVAPMLIACEEH